MMRFFANGSPRDCSFFTASFIPYVPKQGILMRLKWAKIVKKGRFSTNKSLNTVLCTVCWVFSHWLTDVQNCVEHFKQIVNSEFLSLHYLLPAKRDTQLISRLQSTAVYPTFRAWTNRFKNSFLLPV